MAFSSILRRRKPATQQPGVMENFSHALPPTSSASQARRASRRPSLLDDVRKSSSLAKREFPMYVLPISELLQLERLPSHENILDKLVIWEEGMAVVFVSQTWLSDSHPDNDENVKLTLLKQVLQRARDGDLAVSGQWAAALAYGGDLSIPAAQLQQDLENGYVWFDIFSVPQTDQVAQGRAIGSIMSYVADATYFMVLTGSWTHADNKQSRDFSGWRSRGWVARSQR